MRILIIFYLFSISCISQEKGRLVYKTFFSVKQATEELKEKDRIWYDIEVEREMMSTMLRFNLDFNSSEASFYMAENMISDLENPLTKKYVIGLFYGLDNFYWNRQQNYLIEQLKYSFGTILKKKDADFINWNLTNETKQIQGYTCYKATYTYIQKWNGREFEWPVVAWYCPQIPIPLGPVRYSGLPGLILELHENNIGFVIENINFSPQNLKIKEPKEGDFLTDEEIKNRNIKMKENLSNQN